MKSARSLQAQIRRVERNGFGRNEAATRRGATWSLTQILAAEVMAQDANEEFGIDTAGLRARMETVGLLTAADYMTLVEPVAIRMADRAAI